MNLSTATLRPQSGHAAAVARWHAPSLRLLLAFTLLVTLLAWLVPARALSVSGLALDDTVQQADAIVVGTVTARHSRWGDASRRFIQTDVTLTVDDVILASERGDAIGKSVVLTYWGGTIGNETQTADDLRVPVDGERVVVMLHSRWTDRSTLAPTVGFNQGLFTVVADGDKLVVRDGNGQTLARMPGGQVTRGASAAGATSLGLPDFTGWLRANLPAIKARPLKTQPTADRSDPRVLKTFSARAEMPADVRPTRDQLVAMSRELSPAGSGRAPSAPAPAPAAAAAPATALVDTVMNPVALRHDERIAPKWASSKRAHLPIVVNNFPDSFAPWSPEDEWQMSKWNYYADNVFRVFTTPTGTFGWPNDRFDLAGWPSETDLQNVYGSSWFCGSGCVTLGVCFSRTDANGWILEADIALNPGVSWTLDDEWVFDGTTAKGFRQTMTHEMGHMLGLSHDFDSMAVMNYFQPSNYRYFGFPFQDDALGIRAIYPGNAVARTDLGVYLYYETRSCFDGTNFFTCLDEASFPATVNRGSAFVVNNYHVENVGTTSIATPTIEWYLTTARNYDAAYHGLGSTTYPTLNAGFYFTPSTVGRTLTVGSGVPPGNYFLAAFVRSDGGAGQGGFPFGNNYAFSESTIKVMANTSTALASAPNPSNVGQAVTFTAQVGGATPTGNVRFADGGTTITGCSAVSLSGGQANCNTSALGVGTHSITANYLGNTWNNPSTSSPLTHVVKNPSAGSGRNRDYDGNGKSDLVWRNSSSGYIAMWLMNGATPASSAVIYASSAWNVTHTGDLSGDGKTDLLWRSTGGQTSAWLMNGTSTAASAVLLTDPAWSVVRVADLTGDGKSDLIWRNGSTGQTAVWLMNGLSVVTSAMILTDPNWQVVETGDFNGDGKADLVWRNTASGQTALWLMNGTAATSTAIVLSDPNWQVVKVGDFNGDGKSDLVWRNTATGHTVMWLMNGLGVTSSAIVLTDPAWQVTHVADLNGDGKSDLVWRNTTTGHTAAWLMNGLAMASGSTIYTDAAWSVTHASDLNGDGKGDLVWRHTSGLTAVWLMNGLGVSGGGTILADPSWSVGPPDGL